MSMYCYQCEQTAKGTGCDAMGVCGKDPEVAALQDMLIHCAKTLGRFVTELRAVGVKDREADRFIVEAMESNGLQFGGGGSAGTWGGFAETEARHGSVSADQRSRVDGGWPSLVSLSGATT